MRKVLRAVQRCWRQVISTIDLPNDDSIACQYITWRDHFLWQRLRLWLWLALICALSFTLRNIYNAFYPLREFAELPREVTSISLIASGTTLTSLLVCFVLYQTRFSRHYPGLLFLLTSWSLSLIGQFIATFYGFAIPDTISWTLLFISQATVIPVRWPIHLVSQSSVLIYYFGVNTLLGLKIPLPRYPEIYNVTFVLYLFWLCVICDIGVYLYERLQRSEFYARKELERAYHKRQEAEVALQEQLNFLQALIHTLPTPVFYKDAQGVYGGCNKAFEEALGLSYTQIVGKTVYDIAPPELADQYNQADLELFKKGGVQIYEGSIVSKDGNRHDVIFYKATFSKADGTLGGLVGVILDISDRKRTEEALRVFFHAVSHDLRNPVLGTLMVLKNLLSSSEEKILVPRSILERMVQSSDRQLNLINSLMEAHISETQGIILQRQPLQLHTVVEATLADLKPMLAENQATLTNCISPNLPTVNADPTQLWRVYSNLIVNSIKHNPPGLNITLKATIEESQLYCTVSDDGVGMTEQQSDQLFNLYFRGGNLRNSLSLGLGLYLCRQIITAHDGEIGVQTSPGEGATFWFTLPLG